MVRFVVGQSGTNVGGVDLPVLVVEDDDQTRMLIEREVADAGHPVRSVSDGGAALAAVAELARPGVFSLVAGRTLPVKSTVERGAFASDASTLVPSDMNGVRDMFVRRLR